MKRCYLYLIFTGVLLFGTPVFIEAQEPAMPVPDKLTIHVVQRGENLFGIAIQYGTSVDALAQLNGLFDVNNISVGQRLLVPTSGAAITEPRVHIVQPGETLFDIATLYRVDLNALIVANAIVDANQIYPGQQIIIDMPQAADAPLITPMPPGPDNGLTTLSPNFHIVAEGETLYQIAIQYDTTVHDITVSNNIEDPIGLYVGQRLVIPGMVETTPTSISLPQPISLVEVDPLILVEGETGSVTLRTTQAVTVIGQYMGRNLQFAAEDERTVHTALLPIAMFTDEGIYPIQFLITTDDDTRASLAFNIRVIAGAYESQNLDISPEMERLLAPSVQESENAILRQIANPFSPDRAFSAPLSLPAAAALNGEYGMRRSYNGGAEISYHSGVDFAAAPDTPIMAAAPGRVVLADTLNIRGNTVMIDHGWGVYTLYAHLNSRLVTVGDVVGTGQVIGSAGSTGRVTGPHLHWEVWVQGVAVNPVPWLQRSFP